MFQAVPPLIIRSSQLYIRHWVFVKILLLLAAIVDESSMIASGSSKGLTNIRCCMYSCELLMMGGGTA